MSDRIFLHGMVFEGRHGVTDEERREPQPIQVDVDVEVDLAAAGSSDDIDQTVDYRDVFEICRVVVEERSYHLLEGIAEALAAEVLDRFPAVEAVTVRPRKPGVPLAGAVEHAGVEIKRGRG